MLLVYTVCMYFYRTLCVRRIFHKCSAYDRFSIFSGRGVGKILTNQLFVDTAPSPKGRECPFPGRYEISGGPNADDVGKALAASKPGTENQDKPTPPCNPPGKQYLTVGCNSRDTMEFLSECGSKTVAGQYHT